jgi:hypothetical protein
MAILAARLHTLVFVFFLLTVEIYMPEVRFLILYSASVPLAVQLISQDSRRGFSGGSSK